MVHEEIIAENLVVENLSDYEIERNKPMSNLIHGVIPYEISVLLSEYSEKLLISSEVTLDTAPTSTSDISIFHKKKLRWKDIEAKEKEMPITTIEILSPGQTIDDLMQKTWDVYFPAGVQSAWIVVPPLKTVSILTPDEKQLVFSQGELLDPVTGIQISVEKMFECLV